MRASETKGNHRESHQNARKRTAIEADWPRNLPAALTGAPLCTNQKISCHRPPPIPSIMISMVQMALALDFILGLPSSHIQKRHWEIILTIPPVLFLGIFPAACPFALCYAQGAGSRTGALFGPFIDRFRPMKLASNCPKTCPNSD